jgi:hypothetical protein
VKLIVPPLPDIFIFAGIVISPLAVFFAILPPTYVLSVINIRIGAMTVPVVIFPFTNIPGGH